MPRSCLSSRLISSFVFFGTIGTLHAQTLSPFTSAPTTAAPVTAAPTTSSPSSTTTTNTSTTNTPTSPPASSSSSDVWGGCVNEKSSSSVLTIGQETIVCLQIGNSVNWAAGVSYIRLGFTPETDQYSRFYIPNSYSNLIANNTGSIWQDKSITVGGASLQTLSFLRLYYDFNSKKVYPFLTIIVNAVKGVITGITWDNACVFCSPSECEEITYNFNGELQSTASSGQPTSGCYIPQAECAATGNDNNRNACDLMLYVVWSGTDINNRAFQSSNSRFSVFPPQEIQDRITQLLPEIPSLGRRSLLETHHFSNGEAVLETNGHVPEF